jgi:starch-binding outer membrane protein, SusD/RagB family
LNKYAALTLKSKVCLFEGTFRKYHNLGDYERILRESANASELIMNSELFSVYSTGKPLADYYDLFYKRDLRGNPENIMAKYFLENVYMHNRTRSINEQSTGFTKDYAESYLCTDGLPISISPLYQGDINFADEFVNRDPRMKQTIYTPDQPFIINNQGGITYMPVPEFNNARCNTGYRIIKCWSPYENDIEQDRNFVPVFIFRYSEVLLNYAEAKAELDECTQQVLDETINPIRDRAGMPHMTTTIAFVDPNWPNWEVPVTPLINEIRRERRIELAIESVRFDDLRRWKAGKLLDNPKTYQGALDPETGNYRIIYPGFTRTWKDKLYLYPLPSEELVLNPNLGPQNPGW